MLHNLCSMCPLPVPTNILNLLVKVFMAKNDHRIEEGISLDIGILTSGTRQQGHKNLYQKTQNMRGYWLWTHWAHVVKQYQVLYNKYLRFHFTISFSYFLMHNLFLCHQKTVGGLTKSDITFVLSEICGWNLAIVCKYELPLRPYNLIYNILTFGRNISENI